MHRRSLILLIVTLDAMGIGMAFPTMPALLRSLLHGDAGASVARHYGYLLAAYASTSLLSSPVLGALSDRYGRRPVLLAGLFGTAFDNLVMALAPTLSILYVGRTLAGVTGASLTVANAYMVDITEEANRAKAFGRMNACFGIGFIAGPVLGGFAGAYNIRAPFYLAAALNGLSALICVFLLPESQARLPNPEPNHEPNPEPEPLALRRLNPFAPLSNIGRIAGIVPLLYVFGTISAVNQITGALWVIYGTTRFGWSSVVVGASLALYGLLYALGQIFLPSYAEQRLGRTGTVAFGMAADMLGFSLFGLARTTLAALSTMPLLAVSGIALPSLQTILSGRVEQSRQGELQGVLTSIASIIAVLCPLAASSLYALLQQKLPQLPGAIWLFALPAFLPCFFLLRGTHPREP